jgi:hypothetical protein
MTTVAELREDLLGAAEDREALAAALALGRRTARRYARRRGWAGILGELAAEVCAATETHHLQRARDERAAAQDLTPYGDNAEVVSASPRGLSRAASRGWREDFDAADPWGLYHDGLRSR